MKIEEEKEKLRTQYQSNRKSLRSIFNKEPGSMVVLIQEGGEINTEKIADCFKKLEYSPKKGISIYPTYMVFKNPREGLHWRRRITIKNTGHKATNVRIFQPNSLAYQIDADKKRATLYPGLCLHAWITYSFKRPSLLNAFLPIEIDKDLIHYHLISIIGTAHIIAEPKYIDFKKVDINFESKTRILTIKNDGERSTKFVIDVVNRGIDIIVLPMRGLIKAGNEVKLKVKVVGLKEGTFFSEFWIKSCQNIRLTVKATIIIPKFEAYHQNSSRDSVLIDFPPTFVDNLKHETFVVRNLSARTINFIVLGIINGELVDISEIDGSKYPAYNVFKICPLEGIMEPFEGRIFNVTYIPTSKASCQLRKKKNCSSHDFLAFLKILRIHVSEVEDSINNDEIVSSFSEESMHRSSLQKESISETSDSVNTKLLRETDPDAITLCIHGEIENSQLIFIPDTLYFGDLKIGEKFNRIISISNPSFYETLTIRFLNNPNARCTPKEGVLEPKKSLEVLIDIKGKIELEPSFKLKFDVIGKTFTQCPSLKRKSRKLFSCEVKCFQNLMMESSKELKLKLITGYNPDKEDDICDVIKLPKIKNNYPVIKPLQEVTSSMEKSSYGALTSPLSPLQIYNIKASPLILNFGKVATRSTGYKKIQFENKNRFSVMIRLISPTSQNIFFPVGNLMILDSKTTIAKLVGFHAKHEGLFSGCLKYIINDNHSFEVKLTVDIVDKYLKIDTEEIVFGKEYLLEEVYHPHFTHVEIKNELNANTFFNWKIGNESSFMVKPLAGSIRPYRNLFIHTSYEPDPFKLSQTEITMNDQNINNISLKLKIHLATPNVIFMETDIDFGKIPLNIPVEADAVLHNAEFFPSTFQVDQNSLLHGITVYPHYGVIKPRGIQILQVTVNFEVCMKFSTFIKVTVQNSLQIKLKVAGQVDFPILKLVPDHIEMKRISADARQTHLISATNQGETKIKLQFLLNRYPEFSISLLPEKKDFLLDTDEVTINPSSRETFYLHFNPVDPASYSFYLPILINEMIGPASNEEPKTLKPMEYLKLKKDKYSGCPGITLTKLPSKLGNIYIDCTVVDHVISFNNLTFKFDTSIDVSEDELSITNRAQKESSFIIRTDSFQEEDSPFHICWTNGKKPRVTPVSIVCSLSPNQGTTFKIDFKPLIEGHFELEAPIFVRGQLDGNLYNILKLEGDNRTSTIESKVHEIYFSPLALNMKDLQNFTLITRNFKTDSKMMVKILNPDRRIGLFTNKTVRVNFPKGDVILKSQKKEMEVSIQISNPEPVSFSTKVAFFDDKNTSSLLITVYGNIDNSLLTTYSCELQKYDDMKKMEIKENVAKNATSFHSQKSQVSQNTKKITDCPSQGCDTSLASKSENNAVEEIKTELLDLPYPHFPIDFKNRNHESYMKKTLLAAEEWLYSNALNFEFYPDVIDGITAIFSDVCKISKEKRNDKMKKHTVKESFFTILERIIGPTFKSFIEMPDLLPENSYERITLLLQLYTDILQFLCTQGAFLAHVSPKFLLNYKDYLVTVKSKKNQSSNPERNIEHEMTKQIFESRSKQCWLDVILQTFKCFKLKHIEEKHLRQKADEMLHLGEKADEMLQSVEIILNRAKVHENRSTSEGILLAWLEYHFEQENKKEWFQDFHDVYNPNDYKDQLQSKLINNFDSCLTDGLVFIAITGSYCPFLIKEFFRNIYICPRTPEESLHNAICVVAAWKKIRLGFLVNPMQIIHPNCVHMLMLITHLYTVMLTYMTKTTVQFTCPLTKSITKKITVKNPTENPVTFVMQFFNNESEFFSTVSSYNVVKLNPREHKKINIKFEARKFQKTKAYLILCGSAIGPHFAPNQTFLLEGFASELTILNEYTVTTRMYEILDTIISIDVPYKDETIYDIWITEEQPKDFSALRMSRWSDIQNIKVPRRLFLNQKLLSVTENAFMANLSITVACLTLNPQDYWLIFKSEHSDFVIKIKSICRAPILKNIFVSWELEPCICPNPPTNIIRTCRLNIKIMIPSRNAQLWKCTTQMLRKILNSQEWAFWSRILDTKFGARLIKEHMGDYHDSLAKEIYHLFETCVTYDVSTSDEMKFLHAPDKLTISDVRPPKGETKLNIHICQTTPPNYETILKLKSVDGKEVRNYKIKFLCQA